MSSLASYKGPKPVQKPTINDIEEDEDDVLISADNLPQHGNAAGAAAESEDMDMDTGMEKPKYAALKANEMTVSPFAPIDRVMERTCGVLNSTNKQPPSDRLSLVPFALDYQKLASKTHCTFFFHYFFNMQTVQVLGSAA